MVPFADVEAVQDLWDGELSAAQVRAISARLDQASAEIRNVDPLVSGLTIDERVAASESFAMVVRGVVVDMVRRAALVNPNGRLEVHADDAGYRMDSSVSTGALYLSPAEFRKLFGAARGGRVFSVSLGTPDFGCNPWA